MSLIAVATILNNLEHIQRQVYFNGVTEGKKIPDKTNNMNGMNGFFCLVYAV